MKLWLVTRRYPDYGEVYGYVLRAGDEAEARRIAGTEPGCGSLGVWLDPAAVACEEVLAYDAPGVVLRAVVPPAERSS